MNSREQFDEYERRNFWELKKMTPLQIWQASREALVVKMPAPDDLYEDYKILFDGESDVVSTKAILFCGKLQLLLIKALDQAGVRYE